MIYLNTNDSLNPIIVKDETMPTVNMPRASWDTLIVYLEDLYNNSGVIVPPLVTTVVNDIANQVYSQEY